MTAIAGSKSDYLENLLLNHIFGKAATLTIGSSLFVGLWTATLTDASTGATTGEPSAASYTRSTVANDSSHWPTASGGATSNTLAISFPSDTDTNWGTITYFAITTSGTTGAGNIYYWGQLTASKAIQVGDTASFAAGQLQISED